MDYFLRSFSYVFHPLLVPLFGCIFYFTRTPRFITIEIVYAKLTSITFLTFVLPILLFFLLKTLGFVKSIHLKTTKERIFPLAINGSIILIILKRVLPETDFIELYYFFVGILISTIICLILVLAKFKASIHMIAICGFFMFVIALSIHFSINVNNTLALLAIITGAVATSRLHLKAHTNKELILGGFIGVIPQLMVLEYWL